MLSSKLAYDLLLTLVSVVVKRKEWVRDSSSCSNGYVINSVTLNFEVVFDNTSAIFGWHLK